MGEILRFENIKHFLFGLVISFVISATYLAIYHDSSVKKSIFGFFYFLITPFLAISSFPMAVPIMIIFFLLFRRISTCMRENLRWLAYTLMWLHWIAFGMYCSTYVVI